MTLRFLVEEMLHMTFHPKKHLEIVNDFTNRVSVDTGIGFKSSQHNTGLICFGNSSKELRNLLGSDWIIEQGQEEASTIRYKYIFEICICQETAWRLALKQGRNVSYGAGCPVFSSLLPKSCGLPLLLKSGKKLEVPGTVNIGVYRVQPHQFKSVTIYGTYNNFLCFCCSLNK